MSIQIRRALVIPPEKNGLILGGSGNAKRERKNGQIGELLRRKGKKRGGRNRKIYYRRVRNGGANNPYGCGVFRYSLFRDPLPIFGYRAVLALGVGIRVGPRLYRPIPWWGGDVRYVLATKLRAP